MELNSSQVAIDKATKKWFYLNHPLGKGKGWREFSNAFYQKVFKAKDTSFLTDVLKKQKELRGELGKLIAESSEVGNA